MGNPTTNFGWQMPTATDLVTDLPADFEVFGQAVDTDFVDLLGGTTGQVLSKTSATDMAFTWVDQDDSNAIQNAIVDAKGDLIGATAADTPSRLAVGTDGQVLTADSTEATGLKWVTAGGGGKVLQVVQGTLTSNATTTSATYVDSGLTVTITPSSATSKIQIISMMQSAYATDTTSGSNCLADFNLVRGATQLQYTIIGTGSLSFGADYKPTHQVTFAYLDSPATTSATTYKIQMKRNTGSSVGFSGSATAINSIVVMEIGA